MSDEINKIVEQKIKERLDAIESNKNDNDVGLRIFLAFLGACIAGWLSSKLGATEENTLWAIGIGVFLGGIYELLQFAIVIIFIVALVKCVG